MQIKDYPRDVLKDLSRYLSLLVETENLNDAYRLFWEEKHVRVGFGGLPSYKDIIKGVPNLCMKVPTGGGKTYLACRSIKLILDALPPMKARVVVWLVPSETILTQTLEALRNSVHPYRQAINADFSGRVAIYSKQELLNAQNFNLSTVSEQLSIMVLSYDSFRGRKESLKAKRENSNLAPMAKALGTPDNPIADADETALLQVINQLCPIVIVDESHHAKSTLSKEMLTNFNPSFILDLTATPTKESNVLCYVDAVRLKRENMVKLPVIVYNRNNRQEVLADAIDLRNCLELRAKKEQELSGRYIRPIVLFQAQPKGTENAATFERLREHLIECGIPREQIAIKTANINELKGIDLLSDDCQIRYIITINALKEGWDCPFAYILASLANKTSTIEVEQIVGRVLRQPYTKQCSQKPLNMSYVLTSSADFGATLDGIVKGLNNAGFTDKDYRLGNILPENPTEEKESASNGIQMSLADSYPPDTASTADSKEDMEDFQDINPEKVKQEIQNRNSSNQNEESASVSAMLTSAETENEAFETAMENEQFGLEQNIPREVQDYMSNYWMNQEFVEEVKQIKIPQFSMKVEQSIFKDGYDVPLQKDHLAEDFSLRGKPYDIDFSQTDRQMVSVDVREGTGNKPKVFQMSESDQRAMKRLFSQYSPEQKIRACKGIIHQQLNRIDAVESGELSRYIDLVVEQMDSDTLSALENAPQGFAARIKKYIEHLIEVYDRKQFKNWVEIGKITCQPTYEFPPFISPLHSTATYGKSLYQAEEDVNGFEEKMVMALTGLPNVRWWHRNISGSNGFCLNGFRKRYPDFIVMTERGKIVLVETKGDYLDNPENRDKLDLGRVWEKLAGERYRYYMVFEHRDLNVDGAFQFDKFIGILKQL